jgi:hypothetical protein
MPIWGFSFGGNMISSGQVNTCKISGRAARGGDGAVAGKNLATLFAKNVELLR